MSTTTLGELRKTYSFVHKEYNSKAYELAVKRNELKEKIEKIPNGEELWGKQVATVELQYNAVQEQLDAYNGFISQVMEQWDGIHDRIAAEQNAEATEDYYKELGKIMQVVMRMCQGHNVPGKDEQKVQEYDKDLYMAAKNAQAMAQMMEKKHKKDDSLWEDEDEKEYEDPMEVADSTETELVGPEIIPVDDVVASATESAPVLPTDRKPDHPFPAVKK